VVWLASLRRHLTTYGNYVMRRINKDEVLVECRCETLEAIRKGSDEQIVAVLNWFSEQLCPKFTCSKNRQESLQPWLLKCECSQHWNLKKALSRVLLDSNLVHRSVGKDTLPLHLACSYSSTKVFSLLLQLHKIVLGEEAVKLCDSESGWNILHRCCYFGHLGHLKVFLQSDLDENVESSNKICLRSFRDLCSLADNEDFLPLDLLLCRIDTNADNIGVSLSYHDQMIVVFGSNEDYELGTGNNSFERVPRPLDLPNSSSRLEEIGSIVFVSTSTRHSLFLSKNGTVLSVGVGKEGRLGLGDVEPRILPQPVSFLSRVTTSNHAGGIQPRNAVQPDTALSFSKILANGNRSGALTSDGVLYLWGDGVLKPERIEGPLRGLTILDFSFCSSHTAVVTQDGSVFCWGRNDMEQLGIDCSCVKFTTVPRLVSSLKNIVCRYVYVDDGISVVIDSQGKVYFWGNGNASPCKVSLQEKTAHPRKRARNKSKAKEVVFVKKKKCLLILTEEGHLYEFFLLNKMQNNKHVSIATRVTWTRRISLSKLSCQDSDCFALDSYGRVICWSLADEIPKLTIRSDLRMVSFLTISGRHGLAGIKVPAVKTTLWKCSHRERLVPSLQELCERKLEATISLTSVLPLLSTAFHLGIQGIMQSCLDFLYQSFDTILCFFPQTFANLESEVVSLLERHWKEKFKNNILVMNEGTTEKNVNKAAELKWSFCTRSYKSSKEARTANDTSKEKPSADIKEQHISVDCTRREIPEIHSANCVCAECTKSSVSTGHTAQSPAVVTESNKRDWTLLKRREHTKVLYSSSIIHRESACSERRDELLSPSKSSPIKLSLRDAIKLEENRRRNSWNTEALQKSPKSSFNLIQLDQLREMNKDQWSSLCISPAEFKKKIHQVNSPGEAEIGSSSMGGKQLGVSSPSIPIAIREGSNVRSFSVGTSSPVWMEENNARREPTSFRDILDEEERRKCYFSKSLSPSSFSPCSSTVWKKLPSEEPVMVKSLKKIETEELALKTLREQYPSAEVKRAPLHR